MRGFSKCFRLVSVLQCILFLYISLLYRSWTSTIELGHKGTFGTSEQNPLQQSPSMGMPRESKLPCGAPKHCLFSPESIGFSLVNPPKQASYVCVFLDLELYFHVWYLPPFPPLAANANWLIRFLSFKLILSSHWSYPPLAATEFGPIRVPLYLDEDSLKKD